MNRSCKSNCSLGFIREEHNVVFSDYLLYGKICSLQETFPSTLLISIHAAALLWSPGSHTRAQCRQVPAEWMGGFMTQLLQRNICLLLGVSLSQCQMSACCSSVLVPLPGHFQCKKHCTLFGREMTFSHCSLGSEHKYPVAAETQRTGARPWAAAGAPVPTAEVPNSCSED